MAEGCKTPTSEAKGLKRLWERLKCVAHSKQPWREARELLGLNALPPVFRRVLVGVIGTTVILLGAAMLVLPGPGLLVIPLGLIILATEFVWARRSVRKVKDMMKSAKGMVSGK